MLRNTLKTLSIPLILVQLLILYFWIFDWEKLVTQIGLITWIVSIVLGIVVYFIYLKLSLKDKESIVNKRIVLCSTLLTIVLAMGALLIEFVTSSMP
ncbi:hypothetical protein CCZ20_22405 [Priestia aryabhattai]|nr:hypothetical protein [Priestia aryabhattai]MBZ6486597.1 hypothetical protein [Priestia aryabhattai]OVE35167.1 hypothetical protein CCZ20_22405 [Priestia aryabhattai]